VKTWKKRWKQGRQQAIPDICGICITADTQTYNSPHVQFLFLEILMDPPPLPHLRFAQLSYP
jgi:hypothetical protein